MDPITLAILIGAGGAAAAGITAALGPLWRHYREKAARELVQRPVIGASAGSNAPRSVYDIYQDLGSDDYALEVLRHLSVIPEKEEELELVASNLSDAISSYGGYDSMVTLLRETIGEFSEEGTSESVKQLGTRLTLDAPRGVVDSLLPAVGRPSALPEAEEIKRLQEKNESPRFPDGTEETTSKGPRLHATVDEALADLFGDGRSTHAGALKDGSGGIAAIVIGGVLGSLTTGGSFWDGVSRFVHRRRVKKMRSQLNEQLAGLSLDLFHSPPDISGQVEDNLTLITQNKRWTVERRRREIVAYRKRPRKKRNTTELALKLLAAEEAREALTQSERDVKKLRKQITRHRRSARHDLAGFLIYVNREDLLHGVDYFDQRIVAIEDAGEQLRQALLAEVPTTTDPD